MNIQGYITEPEQAQRLERTVRTLQLWRKKGVGPVWVKIGKTILYPENAVQDLLKANEQHPVRERRNTRRHQRPAEIGA